MTDTKYPIVVLGYKSPKPTQDIVINVNHIEFSKDFNRWLYWNYAILIPWVHARNHPRNPIVTAKVEFYLNQHFKA